MDSKMRFVTYKRIGYSKINRRRLSTDRSAALKAIAINSDIGNNSITVMCCFKDMRPNSRGAIQTDSHLVKLISL
jgi:hypothetical protein